MGFPRLTNLGFQITRWLSVHKLLTGGAAIITIAGILWATLNARGSNIHQVILTVWLCIFFLFALALAFLKSRQARLALAGPSIHNVFHKIRDAYYSLTNEDTPTTVMEHIGQCLASFADVFSVLAGASCRACIKQVSCSGRAGEHHLRSVQVTTFCRHPSTPDPIQKLDQDYVSDNTDYLALFRQAPGNYFYSNDLLQEKGYQNSHWTPERVREGKFDYRSTIVWPIRKILAGGDHHTWGFLCVDSIRPHVFVIDLDFFIGAAVADALYVLLKEMDDRIKREEAQ
ncbi:MAG: hypothetical protein V1792_08925 [Pseudomonadota bacterium]